MNIEDVERRAHEHFMTVSHGRYSNQPVDRFTWWLGVREHETYSMNRYASVPPCIYEIGLFGCRRRFDDFVALRIGRNTIRLDNWNEWQRVEARALPEHDFVNVQRHQHVGAFAVGLRGFGVDTSTDSLPDDLALAIELERQRRPPRPTLSTQEPKHAMSFHPVDHEERVRRVLASLGG